MAATKITIYVNAARGSSSISYSTAGRYVSLLTADVGNQMPRQPLQPTSGSRAFWESVIALVVADITAGRGGGT